MQNCFSERIATLQKDLHISHRSHICRWPNQRNTIRWSHWLGCTVCFMYDIYISTLIPAWISNYIHYVWNKGIYPFPNFKGTSIEVWEGIINFIPHFTLCVTTELHYVRKSSAWCNRLRLIYPANMVPTRSSLWPIPLTTWLVNVTLNKLDMPHDNHVMDWHGVVCQTHIFPWSQENIVWIAENNSMGSSQKCQKSPKCFNFNRLWFWYMGCPGLGSSEQYTAFHSSINCFMPHF